MEKLKEVRKKAGLTQVELAEKVGCSQVCVARWEKGTNDPSLKMAKALAEALKCKIDDIL